MERSVKHMLENDLDFIAIKRYKFSLAALENRYPDGAPDHIIAKALEISEDQVEARYQQIVLDLRAKMGV
jgi:hypothetical protein